MEFIIIGFVAFVASMLTFFSGFGLGTILTPAFLVFFPIEVAITLTGIVHLLNNLFKISLIWRHINKHVLLRFGITAILGAVAGASSLIWLSGAKPIYEYSLGNTTHTINPENIVIAALMIFFALFEIVPKLKNVEFGKHALIPGGLLSGFFGGLSGHQGAMRSAFLIRFGLNKEAFIATGITIACFVDFSRIGIYFTKIEDLSIADNIPILATATLAAFTGAFIGRQLLKKITINFVQLTVSIMMMVLAIALAIGLI